LAKDNCNLDQPAFFDRMVLAMTGPPGRSVASPGPSLAAAGRGAYAIPYFAVAAAFAYFLYPAIH